MEAFYQPSFNESRLKDDFSNAEIKITKSKEIVPDLLLGYTYFLNQTHSAHITIGYDVDDFSPKIVLFKNNKFIILNIYDWSVLTANDKIIKEFLYAKKVDFIEIPNSDKGLSEFKLSTQKNIKCLVMSQNNKKLVLDSNECLRLYNLLTYVYSICKWYENTSKEIEEYYNQYFINCIKNETCHLSSHQFFALPEHKQISYNLSRVFTEIPILCYKKLQNDMCKYYDSIDC